MGVAFDLLDDRLGALEFQYAAGEAPESVCGTDEISHHPLIKDTAILPTRALEDFVNAVRVWLDNLLPGAIVYGAPRVGKTHAIRFLMENANAVLGAPIPTTLFSCWEYAISGTSESRFFGELLQALGYGFSESGTGQARRRRAISCMLERANEVHEHRYLLLVDEAQWLTQAHYRFLMDLHNQLKLKDIRLIVILVGQPELQAIKESFRSANKRHLLGRFMTGSHRFCGVVGQPDFQRMLQALDAGSEYPRGSGISFTQYFVPKAFAAGWRIAAQGDRIWTTLDRVCRSENIPNTDELPVQPLTACFRWLFKTLRDMDAPKLELTNDLIEEAIYRVALLQIEDHALQKSTQSNHKP